MRKIIICLFVILSIFAFSFVSSAASYIPYSGVTDSSSQVNTLYDAYVNTDDFNYRTDFLIMRSDQYSYYLFYGDLSSNTVDYIKYSTSNGYNATYVIEYGVDNDFSYTLNEYTVVGTVPGSLSLTSHKSDSIQSSIKVLLVVLVICLLFYIFRSHFSG